MNLRGQVQLGRATDEEYVPVSSGCRCDGYCWRGVYRTVLAYLAQCFDAKLMLQSCSGWGYPEMLTLQQSCATTQPTQLCLQQEVALLTTRHWLVVWQERLETRALCSLPGRKDAR
jgi:hypothetical protein